MVRIDGAKIKELRESKKLTQLYLSTVVGVTTDTISRWENRHYQSIKLENAEKLAQALEVSFDEILKSEERHEVELVHDEADSQKETGQTVSQLQRSKPVILAAILLIAAISVFVLFSMFSEPQQVLVSAKRILPPHVSPGQTFPVLIRVSSINEKPVSLIIKEIIPKGTQAQKGLPDITSIDRKENSLKWIRRLDTDDTVYAYLCQAPVNISLESRLIFDGTVTLKKNVNDRQTIEGDNSLVIAQYHWADQNRDYVIDDEEILAVYDTYSDIEELPFDRELIDSIWASSGYTWNSAKGQFVTVD